MPLQNFSDLTTSNEKIPLEASFEWQVYQRRVCRDLMFFQPKTICIPRGIIPQNCSSLSSAVLEELGNKQTHSGTPYCFTLKRACSYRKEKYYLESVIILKLFPRAIIPQNFSSFGFVVLEELRNKQTNTQTHSLTSYCF